MAASPLSLSWFSSKLSNKFTSVHHLPESSHRFSSPGLPSCNNTNTKCANETDSVDESTGNRRRPLLLGLGAFALSSLPVNPLLAEEKLLNYRSFVDKGDGYSYFYPSDWVDFDFKGYDSAFKDRYLQLQNVRVSFLPTEKTSIRDLGPMDEVVFDLVTKIYAAPSQRATIFDIKDKTVDGKDYYTVEYDLTSKNFSRTAFVTIAIANGRFYTLNVGANERRWKKFRNQLKVVADSFKVLDI